MLKISTCVLKSAFSFANRTPHQILGVKPYATVPEIKQAFFKLAKTHHPDVSEANSAADFTSIRIAYQHMLKQSKSQQHQKKAQQKPAQQANNKQANQKKCQKYQSTNYQQKKSSRKHNFDDFNEEGFDEQEIDMDWDMEVEDLKEFEKAFNSYLHHGYLKKKYYHYKIYIDKILGQDSYYSEAVRRESVKNKKKESKKNKYNALDLIHNLSLDIDELGSEKVIKIQRNVLCKNCEFFSEKNYVKIGCNSCKKTGIDENYEKCKECLGKGFHRKYECKTCENKKYVKKSFDELIMIPLGANNGEKIVFKGRGHQHVKNGNFGDLVIVVCLTSKTGFSSKNPNLKISIADAVLGLNKKVNTIKGIKKVCIPPGVQDGEVLQLENIFYDPHKSEEYIKIELKIPQQISEAEKQVYQKLKKIQILKKERLKDDS